MTNALSATGRRRLDHYERVIQDGLGTFQKVGDALLGIRDEKLYRSEFDTFEAYCKARWAMSDRRARQLMTAAEIGTVVPVDNEAQARALAPIKDEPKALREVVAQAEADGDKSARNLSKYVKNFKNVEAKGCNSPPPGATGESPLVEEASATPNETAANGHARGEGEPAASSAIPLQPDAVETTCPHCGGTGRVSIAKAS